ncbi:PKD domain-containing protein [Massilia sp. TSP1-1-2]|uniref:PKD domain-containing protein n=1 Tax=Massilia sp. TSP1-1-2 TaxID=2804649 RepID=UPI003CEEE425
MLNFIKPSPSQKLAVAVWLPCLLAGLTLAAAASARQAAALEQGADSAHAALQRTTYRIINLANGDYIAPALINASGQVAFSLANGRDGPLRSFFYDGKTVQDISTLGADFARVTGLNDHGHVTGVSQTKAGIVRSFVWSKRRGMIDLGALPGAVSTWEPAINNRDEITGESNGDPLPYPRAFRWTLSSGMEDLGGLASGADTIAYGRAINDNGLIAGNSLTPAYDYHAFAWERATGIVDIDTLGNRYSDAVGVDANGQIGGNFFVDNGNTHAFIWTRGGGMRDIGTAGGEGNWIVGMTASGRMTGVITSTNVAQRAMTWTRATGIVMLGTFGGATSFAIGANNKGQVVGGAATVDDDWRAFVWTAKEGLVDLNTRLRHAPAGLTLHSAQAVSDKGAILAISNAGLVLLVPERVCGCRHAVGPIAAAELVKVGTPLDVSVSFAGEDRAARHNVIWSWGDGSGDSAGNTMARNGSGSATGSHTFGSPGMYTVSARVADLAGNSAAVSRKIIVYDQSRGFAGGAGSFTSPHVPNKKAPFQAGLATFSFIAPAVTRGEKVLVAGQLDFQVGGLNFRSKELRPTGMQGVFAGNGTINGAGNYQFSMGAKAGNGKGDGAGNFSLKIWRVDPMSGAEMVAYDNQGQGNKAAERKVIKGVIAVQ